MIRTITAPGIEITETDKSVYSQSMTGTACLVAGFTSKGEPYVPNTITSRTAFTNYYGTPSTEAERYSYAAACEILNQNGNLIFTKLPYDNAAYNKIAGFSYNVNSTLTDASTLLAELSSITSIKKALTINPTSNPTLAELSDLENYRTGEKKVKSNTFEIFDKTFGIYNKIEEDDRRGKARELIGIMPVVTTAANALYAQNLINVANENVYNYENIGIIKNTACSSILDSDCCLRTSTYGYYTDVTSITLLSTITFIATGEERTPTAISSACISAISAAGGILSTWSGSWQAEGSDELSITVSFKRNFTKSEISGKSDISATYLPMFGMHGKDGIDDLPFTVSQDANTYFPTIPYNDGKIDRTTLHKIGVVVYKLYLDSAEGNKINFEAVESFAGSLNKNDTDPTTKASIFIDTIINNNSNYINFFSNCFNTSFQTKKYDEFDLFVLKSSGTTYSQPICSTLGFFSEEAKKKISVSKSIQQSLNIIFDKLTNTTDVDIDIVVDAGIANIASFIASIYGDVSGEYDIAATDDSGNSLISQWKCNSNNVAVRYWKTIEQMFDTFCKQRKDCMFIADGLRPLVLQGQVKTVRPTKYDSSIDTDIIPYVKLLTGLNTSYGAGYINWFEITDDYSGELFWCPPSIKAAGIYIYTDTNFNYWDAPAGLTRGIVSATDTAFNPTIAQAGQIYDKNWNYAINYVNEGIALEGQKTFQTTTSAFDRINVRRLFLRLERQTFAAAKYFLYEGNTAYNRQRLVDTILPYYKAAKAGDGIYDYKIICDETNNSETTIDNNELHVSVGIKPTKTIEWIIINFIALNSGGSYEEVGL